MEKNVSILQPTGQSSSNDQVQGHNSLRHNRKHSGLTRLEALYYCTYIFNQRHRPLSRINNHWFLRSFCLVVYSFVLSKIYDRV